MWARAAVSVAMRGPGKALLVASAVGWSTMAWLAASPAAGRAVGPHAHEMSAPGASVPFGSAGHFAAMWLAMILAMAPPLLLREVGRVWRTSLRRLRLRTTGLFVCGYVGVWGLVGVGAAAVSRWMSTSPGLVVIVASIGLWHCSPVRQRCLNACHRVPALRVFGAAAQYDALRFGVSAGGVCAATCGPAMLLVLLTGDLHLVAMAAAALVATAERYRPPRRPAWRLPVVGDPSPRWPGMWDSRVAGRESR